MTFKELREASGMSRKQFAEYFGMSYRAVQSWELGDRQCPQYLLDLMEYKLKHEGFIK
jgi:DNA-binding transcriptional regulator YiaG